MRSALFLAALCIQAALGTWYNVVPDCEFAPGVQCRQIVDGILATTANPVWRNTDVVVVTFIDAVNYNTAKVVDFFNVDNYYSSYNWAIPLKVEVYTNCPDKDSALAQCHLASTQSITPNTGTIGDFSTTTYTQTFPDSSGVVKVAIYPTPGTAICLVEVQAFYTAPPPTLFPVTVVSAIGVIPSISTTNNPSGCCQTEAALTDGVHAHLGLIPPSDVTVFGAKGTIVLQLAQRIELTLVSVSFYHLIRRDVPPITGLTFNVPAITVWISDNGVDWGTPAGVSVVPVFTPLDNDLQFADITFNGVQTNFLKLEVTPGGKKRDEIYTALDEIVVGGHVPTVSPSVSSSPVQPSGVAVTPTSAPSASSSPSATSAPIALDIKLSKSDIGVNGGQTDITVHLTGNVARQEAISVTLKFDGTGSSTQLDTDYTLDPIANVVSGFPQVTVMIAKGSVESNPIRLTTASTRSVAQQAIVVSVVAASSASGPFSSSATGTIRIINACLSNPPPCVEKATCQNLGTAAASYCQCPAGYTGDGFIAADPWKGNGCSCATDNLLVNGKATVGEGTPGGRDGLGGWTVTGTWTTTLPNSIPTRDDDPARNAFGTTVHKGSITQDVEIVCQENQIMEFGGIVYGVGNKDDVRLIVQYLGKNGNSKSKIVIAGAEKAKEQQGPVGNWVPISVSTKVPKNVAGARLTVEIQRRGAGAAAPVVFIDNLYFQAKVFKCPALNTNSLSPRQQINYGCTKDGGLDYPCAIGCRDGYIRSDTRDTTPLTGKCKEKGNDDDLSAAYDIQPERLVCVGWSANSYQQD